MSFFSANMESCLGRLFLMGDASATNVVANALSITSGASTSGSEYLWVSLHTASPGEASGTGDECIGSGGSTNYGSYSRRSIARTTASWSETTGDPTFFQNAVPITFTQASSGSCTVTDWGIWTASTGGRMLFYGPITNANSVYQVAYFDNDSGTGDAAFALAHGLSDNDRVRVFPIYDGLSTYSVMPSALDSQTLYYVVNSTLDTFELSLTLAGAAVAIAEQGSCLFIECEQLSISTGVIPSFAIGAMGIQFG